MFLLLIASLLTAPYVDIQIAPDQAIPHVYVDEPLIAEFRAPEDARAGVELTLEGESQPPMVVKLGEVTLRAHTAYWLAMENVAKARGNYDATFRLTVDGAVTEKASRFCRVDRPAREAPAVRADLESLEPDTLVALSGIPLKSVRFDASAPDIAQLVEKAATKGFEVTVLIDTGNLPEFEAVAKNLASESGGRVSRWEVNPGGKIENLATVDQALRQGRSSAAVDIVIREPEALPALLKAGAGPYFRGAVLIPGGPDPLDIPALQNAAAEAGYEGIPISIAGQDVPPGEEPAGTSLLKQLVLDAAAGAKRTAVSGVWIYADGDFGRGYVYLSALAHQLTGSRYVGELGVSAPARAYVFRSGGHWVVALWNEDGPVETSVPVGNVAEAGGDHAASSVALADARNNALEPVVLTDGKVSIAVDHEPRFLTGQGGTVLAQAAWQAVRREAAAFAETEPFRKVLPAELVELVAKMAAPEYSQIDRRDFFTLLKAFSHIEEQWHAGMLTRAVAVPAMARLSRLARALCVLEQERGEPFLQSLEDTLAECTSYQTLYLTGSGGSTETLERGTWLLNEVTRLMGEAEDLAKADRPIEAAAVAAMAEWRARALTYATKAAPLSQPDPNEHAQEAQESPPDKKADAKQPASTKAKK